jgi:hypothetical protein
MRSISFRSFKYGHLLPAHASPSHNQGYEAVHNQATSNIHVTHNSHVKSSLKSSGSAMISDFKIQIPKFKGAKDEKLRQILQTSTKFVY